MIFLQKYGIHQPGNFCISQQPEPIEEPHEPFYLFPALPFQMFAPNTLAETKRPA